MKLCVIPARGGSKRLPRKNIFPLLGKPLIAYAIECAKETGLFDRILVDTDDEAIRDETLKFHSDVVMRDPSFATDHSTLSQLLVHRVTNLGERGEHYEHLCLLIPTSPLREPSDVVGAWEKMQEGSYEGVLSVTTFEHTPQWAYFIKDGLVTPYWPELIQFPRPDLEPLFRHDGSVMWMRVSALLRHQHYNFPMGAYQVPPERSVDIDTIRDVRLAEFFMQNSDEKSSLRDGESL